jgi:hypothetical protein
MKNPISSVIARKFGFALVRDRGGSASHMGGMAAFGSNLKAVHYRDGKPVRSYDFGSGKVTEGLVVALTKDWVGTTNNKAAPILTQLKYMYSGTGATAEQAYDYGLQTPINTASGSITPTLAVVASSNNTSLQWVGTIAYSGSSAVTEWGLFNINQSGSQFNNSAGTFTSTGWTPGTSPAWTVNAEAGFVLIAGTSSGTANQTGAAYYGGYIESNTATAATIAQASNDGISWWTVNSAAGPGVTPTNSTRADLWPLMADHKTFSAINVINGDSIQFTYTLTVQSGG